MYMIMGCCSEHHPDPAVRGRKGLDLSVDVIRHFVIDAVGTAATRQAAVAAVRPGGIIMHIGLLDSAGEIDVRKMTLSEVTFIGTYTYAARDFRDTAQAIFDGRLGDLSWTETRPLSDGAAAFADIRAGRVAAPKIILRPNV